jgi:hypothetical protein
MGFTPSPPTHSSVIKRLTGKIYLPDPYNESIIEVDTKLAGTTASMSGAPIDCCSTMGYALGGETCGDGSPYTACLNGKSYTVFLTNEKPDYAVLLYAALNHADKRVDVEVLEYHGKVNGPVFDWAGNLTGAEPDALWGCGRYNTGAVGPDSTDCAKYENNALCYPTVTCGSSFAVPYLSDGLVVVFVQRDKHLYNYKVGGFTGQPLDLRCCGAYTLLFIGDEGYLHYLDQSVTGLGKDWSFSGCCGEAAILRNEFTKIQRIFIEGEEIDPADIFQNDPYGEAVNNADEYPLSVECSENYYLFYCHTENKIEWAQKYHPTTRVYQPKSLIPEYDNYERWYGHERPHTEGIESETDALQAWMAENTDEENPDRAVLILIDGTVCRVKSARVFQSGDFDVKIGPAEWITTGVARPAVLDEDGHEKYPAVGEYTFHDPFAPWWDPMEQSTMSSGDGVFSLFRTLLGVEEVSEAEDGSNRPLHERIALLEERLEFLEYEKNYLTDLIRIKTLEAMALMPTLYT